MAKSLPSSLISVWLSPTQMLPVRWLRRSHGAACTAHGISTAPVQEIGSARAVEGWTYSRPLCRLPHSRSVLRSTDMTFRLTSAQRCVLADCTRAAILGWLLTDPNVGQQARRLEHKATNIVGFGFSRFATMAMNEIGSDYRPQSVTPGIQFPLSIAEAFALANDVEMEMATTDELYCAGLIASYSPYGQPEVCSRDWRTHVAALAALGLSVDCPSLPRSWRDIVREQLRPFRRAVAAAAVTVELVPAE